MTEEEYNYYPSEKEMAEQEAYSMLINSSLQRYVIDKEKESIISSWQEHQEDEDENTYHSVNYNNWCIIEDGISKIKDDLDLIIEQLAKNSSKELIERKIIHLTNTYKDYPNCLKDCVSYLHNCIEDKHLANLGHTEAWIWLDKKLEALKRKKSIKKTSTEEPKTPLFDDKADIEYLYKGLLNRGYIEEDYKLTDFKNCFIGKPIKEINPIQFTNELPETSKIYLFGELWNQKIIIGTQIQVANLLSIEYNYFKSQKSLLKNSKVTHLDELNRILRSIKTTIKDM